MSNFTKDLKTGKEAEKKFLIHLINTLDVVSFECPKWKFKDYDIKIETKDWTVSTYEVKNDVGSVKTWNLCIEYRYKWEASWIYNSKADYIVYITWWKWYIQNRWELLIRLMDIEKRLVKWWDWWKSHLMLIKHEHMDKLFTPLDICDEEENIW